MNFYITLIWILTALFFACTSTTKLISTNNYVALNNLWQKKTTRVEVIQIYGQKFKEVPYGIIYYNSDYQYPEKAFYFDAQEILTEQFIIIDEKSFNNLLREINCDWKEQEEIKQLSHYFRRIKKGQCLKYSISYVQDSSLRSFEVRWKN